MNEPGDSSTGRWPAGSRPLATAHDRDVFVADEQSAVDVDVVRGVALARLVLREEGVRPDAQLSLMFVDEETMADLHERFMDVDGPTDVLAFPMDDELVETGRQPDQGGRGPGATPNPADEAPLLIGDVVVCPTVATRQVTDGHSVHDELDLLVVHGVLHLLGYDHAVPKEAAEMEKRERELLDRFRTAAS